MSYVLRSFGFNNSILLQHKKLKIQKTWGTEDKVYKTDTTRPTVSALSSVFFLHFCHCCQFCHPVFATRSEDIKAICLATMEGHQVHWTLLHCVVHSTLLNCMSWNQAIYWITLNILLQCTGHCTINVLHFNALDSVECNSLYCTTL